MTVAVAVVKVAVEERLKKSEYKDCAPAQRKQPLYRGDSGDSTVFNFQMYVIFFNLIHFFLQLIHASS